MHRQEFTQPNASTRRSSLVHSSWKVESVINEADLLGWVRHHLPDYLQMKLKMTTLHCGRWSIGEYVVAAINTRIAPMKEVLELIEFLTERSIKAERIIRRSPSAFMRLVVGVIGAWKLPLDGESEIDFQIMYAAIGDQPAEPVVKTRVRRRPAPFELKVPTRRRRIAIYE